MAVGETSGQVRRPARSVSSARRPQAAAEPARPPPAETRAVRGEPAPLVKEADPEFERLLAEEEAIERATARDDRDPALPPGGR